DPIPGCDPSSGSPLPGVGAAAGAAAAAAAAANSQNPSQQPGSSSSTQLGPCGRRVLNGLQNNLDGNASITPDGPGVLQGGHFSFKFDLTFTSDQGAADYNASASASSLFGLDKGLRIGIVPSLHSESIPGTLNGRNLSISG